MSFVYSFSKLDMFDKCPQSFAHKYIWKDAIKEDDSPHLVKGRAADAEFERAIGWGSQLSPQWAHIQPMVNAIRAMHKPETQIKIGLTDTLRETDYWKGEHLRWRIGMDVRGYKDPKERHAVVVDWKTGKVGEDKGQLQLYAAAEMALHPWVETVTTSYVWVEHKKTKVKTFDREHFSALWNHFIEKAAEIDVAIEADRFQAKPSGLCAYCPIHKDQCRHKK